MSGLKLEKIVEGLGSQTYDIRVSLSEGAFIRAQQRFSGQYPTSELVLVHPEGTYSIPLSTMRATLESSYDSLEKARKGEVDVLIGTSDEVRQQLTDKNRTTGIYLSVTIEGDNLASNDPTGNGMRKQVIDVMKEMLQETIDERSTYLQKLCAYLTPELRDSTLNYIRHAGDENRNMTSSPP